MDLKQAMEIAKSRECILLGWHAIPVPVYKVYVSYESFDNDPFFPLQRALLRIIVEIGQSVGDKFAAALLGVDEQLVKHTLTKLKDDKFIVSDPNTGEKKVTDDARRKYLTPGARPTITKSGWFFVDGKSLAFLPNKAYDPKRPLKAHNTWDETDMSVHKPIVYEEHPAEIQKIENVLNNKKRRLESLNLDKEGKNFKVTYIEPLMLDGINLLYFLSKDGTLEKKAYLANQEISTPAIGNVETYTFHLKQDTDNHWMVARNLGYNANDETKDKYIDEPADKDPRWWAIVNKAYSISTSTPTQIEYGQLTKLYSLKVTCETVDASGNPRKLFADCGKERPCLQLPTEGPGMLLLEIIPELGHYLYLEQALQDLKEQDANELAKKLAGISPQWRSDLLSMGCEQELEQIDTERFIHPL